MALSRRLLLAASLSLVTLPALAQGLVTFKTGELVIESGDKRHPFKIELALTPEQQSQGLMFRKSMAADAGMLFIYERPQDITMWMRNTLIPLDMIFIGADGRVVRIAERAVPQSLATISSGEPALGVLEVNGGTAARLGLKRGDLVRHSAFGQ